MLQFTDAGKIFVQLVAIIAAKVGPNNDIPCCEWVGPRGAGHYVKMVHNGIEYGDMQLICEAYLMLKDAGGLSNDELYDEWGIAVISPHFAAAFVARPAGDRSLPDEQRQFQFALTYNREYVVETARNMMSKITPHVPGPALGAAANV